MNLRAVAMVLWTVVWTAIGITVMLLDWSGRLYMYLARVGWAPQVLRLAGVETVVVGLDGLDRKRPYIICSNHASQVDIPILFHALGINIRFLAKRSLFYIPVFGWSLWIARFVPVDRGSSRKSRRSIESAARKIRRGPSLAVFPEGTRTPDGRLREFKSGAFVMGVKAGTPILPVAIRGSYRIVPKSTMRVRPGRVEVIVGTPISTEGMDMKDKDALRRRCADAVARMLETGVPV